MRSIIQTDLNGGGARGRIKNSRSSYDFDVAEADGEVAGNYYPISSSISIADRSSDDSLTILVDRGQAGGSLESGQIDLMLHRRLTHRRVSGDRFLGEILNEGNYSQYELYIIVSINCMQNLYRLYNIAVKFI